MNWKVGSKRCILLLWITANMWKSNSPQPQVAVAYPVNLSSLNWYNYSSPVSRTFILQVQLIFSIVQLFSPRYNYMFLESKSCTTEKKSCTMEKKSCTWSIIVLLTGAWKLYPFREDKLNRVSYRYSWLRLI